MTWFLKIFALNLNYFAVLKYETQGHRMTSLGKLHNLRIIRFTMSVDKQHVRQCILNEFKQGKNASKARKSICGILGTDAVSYETCNYWYRRFRSGEFGLSDHPRVGQPRKFKDTELQALLDADSTITQQELATQLGVTQTAISKRLYQIGKIQKIGRCNYCHLTFGRKDKLHRHEKRHWPQQNTEDKSRELQMMRENLDLGEYNYGNLNNDTFERNEAENDKQEENMVINLDPFNHNEFGSETSLQRGNASESEPKENDLPGIPDHIKDEFKEEDSMVFDTSRDHVTGESFSSEADHDKSSAESPGRPFKCTHCTKRFFTPDNLKDHMARHTGIRPFGCHVCNKSFIRKRELDRHVVTHTGVKPFKCPKCLKSFGRKDKLVRHMRIHDRRENFPMKKVIGSQDKFRKPIFLQNQKTD